MKNNIILAEIYNTETCFGLNVSSKSLSDKKANVKFKVYIFCNFELEANTFVFYSSSFIIITIQRFSSKMIVKKYFQKVLII